MSSRAENCYGMETPRCRTCEDEQQNPQNAMLAHNLLYGGDAKCHKWTYFFVGLAIGLAAIPIFKAVMGRHKDAAIAGDGA